MGFSPGTGPKEDILALRIIFLRFLSSTAFGLIPAFLLFLSPALSTAADVTIAWSPSMDPKVLGYRVYYGPPGRDTDFQADARTETKITLKNLQEGGTYSFTVLTYDSQGRESRYSHKTTVLNLKDKDTHFVSLFPSSPAASSVTPGPPFQERMSSDAPPECEFLIRPASQSFHSPGGSGAVDISTKLDCSWTAVANVPWVTMTSNDSGSGNRVVYYLVKPNPGALPREGTLTVAGRPFRITQTGQARHALTIASTGTGTGRVTSFPAGADFEAGTVVTLTAIPNPDSDFAGWSGQCSGPLPTCAVAIASASSVNALFKLKTFVITAAAGANGSITPSGRVVVSHGGSRKFTFTPKKGYQVGQVKVDGVPVGKTEALFLGNIMRPHRVEATFIPIP